MKKPTRPQAAKPTAKTPAQRAAVPCAATPAPAPALPSPAAPAPASKPRPPYAPHPGSLADRVCRYLRSHPGAELERQDFYRLFEAHGKSVEPFLEACIAHGLVVKGMNEDNNVVWRAGPKLAELARSIPSTAQIGAALHPNAGTRTRRLAPRKDLPPLDPGKIKLERGVPKPPIKTGRFSTVYAPLFEGMEPGTSRLLPTQHAHRFLDAAKQAAKRAGTPQRWSIRKIDDTHSRVWRDA